MSEAEHVTGLVREHFATPAQEECLGTRRPRLAVKCWIVPGKTVNADTLAHRSLSEDEVPRRFRIKVFHGDSENAEGIRGNVGFEKIQDVASENLRIISDWIAARDEGRANNLDRRKHFHFHREKCSRELA